MLASDQGKASMNVQFDPDDVGLSNDETAAILNIKPGTLTTWRSKGLGPRYRKSGRNVEYTRRFIKEYQHDCERSPEPAAVRRQQRALAIGK
jgi:hypothetical protein